MRRSQARNKIAQRLIASQLVATPNIDLGKRFTIPDTGEWCRLSFNSGTSTMRTVGGIDTIARFERQGRFIIQVFTRQDQGSTTGLDLAESIADLYEKQPGDRPVSYRSPNVYEVGVDPDGWLQHAVEVVYTFDVAK